jgi:hypothetical protein
MEPIPVNIRCTSGAEVTETGRGNACCRIPSGPQNRYRLAQLDDYGGLPRGEYRWEPPVTLTLTARAGSAHIPGTWGFGFWNAPLSFSLGLGGASPFPALPSAAWFFHTSPDSHLSFRDDLPGRGFLAQTFRPRKSPVSTLLKAFAGLPFALLPPAARRLRRFVSRSLIDESGKELPGVDVTGQHSYTLEWEPETVRFRIDGETVHETDIVPRPPLGLVIWIDNQYAAFTPGGRLRYGLHASEEPQVLELIEINIDGRPILSAGHG